ncbi:MAG: epoxide hydrolase family protein [Solirubrobacterales bacterium]
MRPEPFEIRFGDRVFGDLRDRLAWARWPEQPEQGWDLGTDLDYARGLCRHWADDYDPERLPGLLNRFRNYRRLGLHLIHEQGGGDRLPLLLLHGWPGGPIEYLGLIPRLLEAGHDVAVPSMPGYAWSDDPGSPLNIAGVAERIRDLVEDGLGWERYGIAGGDWGAPIAARIAFDSPQRVAALYVFTPGTLPPSAELADPPLSEAEQAFIEQGLRWRRRQGHHMLLQSTVPDIVSVGLNDSPAGLAAYLVEKYRRWSDCDGEIERRFSKDQLCDYLTMYWATETIASSMRLYWGERAERWRPGAGERIDVPAAVGVFPAEIINPPREWTERLLTDLRRWTEMPRGGHFAAHEEPQLLADDVLAFVDQL